MYLKTTIFLLLFGMMNMTAIAQSTGSTEGPLEAAFEFQTNCLNIICNNTSQGHIASQWVFNHTDTLFTEDASFLFEEAGTYNVALTIVSGTGASATTRKDITVTTCGDISTSIDTETIISNITTYPNPASSIIHFKLGSLLQHYDLSIYDLIGREMDRLLIAQDELSIHLHNYQDGAYLYVLRSPTGELVTSGRFLVTK